MSSLRHSDLRALPLTEQVVAILAGLLKLWYVHWRVRKYAAIEKLADRVHVMREKSIIRSLSTKGKRTPRRQGSSRYKPQDMTSSDVPFGVKALESGVEVEGVWDSRPNSRRSSMANIHLPRHSSVIDLGRIEAQLPSESFRGSLVASTTASQQFDKAVSAEHLPHASTSQEIPPTNPSRSRYPPHSYMRYDGAQGHKRTNTLAALSSGGQKRSRYSGM